MTQPREELQLPLLFAKIPQPTRKRNFEQFYEALNSFSGNLIQDLHDVPGLVFAGGAILGALVGCSAGDLDIFLVNEKDPERRLRDVYAGIQKNQAARLGNRQKQMLITRSKRAITFFRLADKNTLGVPVQVILMQFNSVQELLLSFDIDSCCFAFEHNKKQVLCTQAGYRAMQYGTNIVDTAKASRNYCRRLEKYSKRGFAVAVPGYLAERATNLHNGEYVYIRNHDLLLRLNEKTPKSLTMDVEIQRFDGLQTPGRQQTIKLNASSSQTAKSVSGMARLIVLDSMQNVKQVETPHAFYKKVNELDANNAFQIGTCMPLSAGLNGNYLLLWGADVEEEEKMDGELYPKTPLSYVYSLLDKLFRRELDKNAEAPEHDTDEMWESGVMHRFTLAMRSQSAFNKAYSSASDSQAARIAEGNKLLFVYDFCRYERSFESLQFVLNARRQPLKTDLNDEEFAQCYGLPPKLAFEKFIREQTTRFNWWDGVY
eukprot:12431451-Karenia_brevis.AAC.1